MSGPRMWPRELSRQIREDPLRRAEVKVYDALQQALSGAWHAFYSRPWLGITSTGRHRDGECDFVIAHAEKGLLFIEVKGGGISYDPLTDSWTSRDRAGVEHSIQDPVEQAMKSKHALMKKLKDQKFWPKHIVRMRHAVIFPDAQSPTGDLGAGRPRELFCCRAEMSHLGSWVEGRLAGGEGSESGPGPAGMSAVEALLAKPFMLRIPLGHKLDDDNEAIAALTPQQFYILDAIAGNHRAAAGGGAGTGKTILACEDACRQAMAGRRTLLTCRGLPLAADLRRRLAGTGVDVLTFEELSASTFDAGMRAAAGQDPAEALLQAAENDASLRYDAIIVDEAQDFRSHWWIALEAVLAGREDAVLHAFFDTNQQLYGLIGAQLKDLSLIPVRLTRNLRNTKAIHAAASKHYSGFTISADGPLGISIESHPVADARAPQKAVELVRRLIQVEAVPASDIAILAPDQAGIAEVKKGLPPGVECSTILNFKGLERSVILVLATRAIADQQEMAYVALSRARTHLILVGEPVILQWLAPSATAS